MYIPPHFKMEDDETMYKIIEENSFATVFSQHQGMPFASHLPLILNKDNTYLYGHFARSNTHWEDIENQMVLAVFHGPHCYVSPSWYETNTAVPTWNYVTVHVYGEVELIHNTEEVLSAMQKMVMKYEDPERAYQLKDVDGSYIAALSKGVQGFKIKISKIEGKAKLSQNHSAERQELVLKELEQIPHSNEQRIASLMKKNLKI